MQNAVRDLLASLGAEIPASSNGLAVSFCTASSAQRGALPGRSDLSTHSHPSPIGATSAELRVSNSPRALSTAVTVIWGKQRYTSCTVKMSSVDA